MICNIDTYMMSIRNGVTFVQRLNKINLVSFFKLPVLCPADIESYEHKQSFGSHPFENGRNSVIFVVFIVSCFFVTTCFSHVFRSGNNSSPTYCPILKSACYRREHASSIFDSLASLRSFCRSTSLYRIFMANSVISICDPNNIL